MKYIMILVTFMTLLTSCGQGPIGQVGMAGPQGPTVLIASESTTQQLVDAENAYREGLGQAALTLGLSCAVQLSGSGQWLSASSPGYNAGQGVVTALAGSTSYTYLLQRAFNQPDSSGAANSILPTTLQTFFAGQNYKISCAGQIIVTDSGYYGFDLNSDDGSILTIDNVQVINNDGNHAMTDKIGAKYLRQGVHAFNMLYAQSGGGNFGLVLKANGDVVPATAFYH